MNYTTSASLYSSVPAASITNDEYLFWHPHWVTIRDCLMGEIAIKRRGNKYLPKLSTQDQDEYAAYLQRAVFYNATARTVNALVGSVHYRPALFDKLPEGVDLTNVTRDGQSFEAFAKRITRELVSVGRYGVLIDAPEDGGPAYLAGYIAEDIIDWSVRIEGGQEKLERVVLREIKRSSDDGLQSELKEVYRVLYLDKAGIYRQRIYENGEPLISGEYTEVVPLLRGRPQTEIPFTFFGPYDFGTDIEKPPILDIAMMNLSHYQSYAQLEQGRFYTAVPVWCVFLSGGGEDDVDYKVGPNTVWQLNSNDNVELKEFGGNGLKFLENALKDKEAQIMALGGKLGSPVKGVAAESSDSVAQRERSEQSFVQSMLAIMSQGMTILLRRLCDWRGRPAPEASVRFLPDALEMYLSDRELRAITNLYKTGLMPVEVLYAVFRDANVLPATMDLEEFKSLLPQHSPDTQEKLALEEGRARIQSRSRQEELRLQAQLQVRASGAQEPPAPVGEGSQPQDTPAKPQRPVRQPKKAAA